MKVALIQMAVSSDKFSNLKKAASMIKEAATSGKAQLIILPECFNCPYGVSHFKKYAEEQGEESFEMLRKTAIETSSYIIGGSIPEKELANKQLKLFNTCYVFDKEGSLIAKHRKLHLFDIDIPGKITFKESSVLSAGGNTTYFEINGKIPELQYKDILNMVEFNLKIGLGICYDLRFPELSLGYAQKGANFLVFPGAFNMTTGPLHWSLLLKARAVDNSCFVAGVSTAKHTDEEGYIPYGHSSLIGPWGNVMVSEESNSEKILYSNLVSDLKEVDAFRSQIPSLLQKRPDMYQLTSMK